MIRACCGTPDDRRAPSPHARDCRYAAAPASSGGPYPLRAPFVPFCYMLGCRRAALPDRLGCERHPHAEDEDAPMPR